MLGERDVQFPRRLKKRHRLRLVQGLRQSLMYPGLPVVGVDLDQVPVLRRARAILWFISQRLPLAVLGTGRSVKRLNAPRICLNRLPKNLSRSLCDFPRGGDLIGEDTLIVAIPHQE